MSAPHVLQLIAHTPIGRHRRKPTTDVGLVAVPPPVPPARKGRVSHVAIETVSGHCRGTLGNKLRQVPISELEGSGSVGCEVFVVPPVSKWTLDTPGHPPRITSAFAALSESNT
jgi:hypothetical protein